MNKDKRYKKLCHAPKYFPMKITKKTLQNWKSRGHYPQLFVKIGAFIYVDLEVVKDFFWGGQEIDVHEKPLVRLKDSIDDFPFYVNEKMLSGWRSTNLYPELFVKIVGTLYVDTRQIPGIIKSV